MPNQYKVIGEQHNEGLEFAFGSVRDHYQDATSRSTSATIEALSKEELLTLGKQAAMDFCVEINSDVPDDFYNKLINQPEETRSNSETPLINPDVKKYLERINALLTDDEPKSPERLIDGLNKINEDAALNLSEQDAIVVYAGTSTCFNSYIYWKENFMKWVIAIKFPDLLEQYSDEELNAFQFINGELMSPDLATKGWWEDSWSSLGETWDAIGNSVNDWWNNGGGKEVVCYDAGGAFYGALEGALLGAAAGGVGAAPGAVAGGLAKGLESSIIGGIAYWLEK